MQRASFPPEAFEKAIVLIDGTNLFYRARHSRLRLLSVEALGRAFVRRRRIFKTYLYTIDHHLKIAKEAHGTDFLKGIKVIRGEGVARQDGNVKEKGVDALLVADLIYHAARGNCQYALIVSVDTDFQRALERVEDFGCNTGLLAVCAPAPESLREACDDYFEISAADMISRGFAAQAE